MIAAADAQRLIKAARETQAQAYVPYSHFHAGAAVPGAASIRL
ncbi:hypothetical protein [Megasphaera hominis]|nr:hypothetical protein [Megasphaera hominis]